MCSFLCPGPTSMLTFVRGRSASHFLNRNSGLPVLGRTSALLLAAHHVPRLCCKARIVVGNIGDGDSNCIHGSFPNK